MRVKTQMTEKLTAAFAPHILTIEDVSHHHAGHAGAPEGGESHFEVDIEATAFSEKTRVQSHRLIYGVLKPLLDTSVHAVALNVKAI